MFMILPFFKFLTLIVNLITFYHTHTLALQVVISQVKITIHYVNSSKNSPSLVNLHWLEFIRFLFRTRASTLIHNRRRCSWHWSTFNSLIFACIGRIFAPLFNGLINLAVRQDCLVGHGQNWQHRFNPWIRGEQVACINPRESKNGRNSPILCLEAVIFTVCLWVFQNEMVELTQKGCVIEGE